MSGSSGPVDWTSFLVGLIAGLLARLISMKTGHRHYPGWPSGWITQFTMGAIAALIGAAIVPALIAKSWTAATFLTLAATQFMGLRKIEMNVLQAEEQLLLTQRGPAYIMGIATTFEARNFVAMLVAVVSALAVHFFLFDWGILVALVALALSQFVNSGKTMGDVIRTRPGKIRFEKGTLLYVDDVMLMEMGLPHSRERILTEGLGVILEPKNGRGEAALWNLAQRQAIAHEASMAVGVQKDVGYPEQTPLVRMRMPYPDGTAALAILPVVHDVERVRKAIEETPLLESVRSQNLPSPHVVGKRIRQEGSEENLKHANGPIALKQKHA